MYRRQNKTYKRLNAAAWTAVVLLMLSMTSWSASAQVQQFDFQQYGAPYTARIDRERFSSQDLHSLGLPLSTFIGDEDPISAAAGSFILYPTLTLGSFYDDNILLSETGAEQDTGFRARPGVVMVSDWERHRLRFLGDVNVVSFNSNSSENYTEWRLQSDGFIELNEDVVLHGFANTMRQNVDRRLDFNVVRGERVEFDSVTYGSRLEYRPAEMPIRSYLEIEQQQLQYEDTLQTNYSDANATMSRAELQLGYAVTPDVVVYVEPSFTEEDFDDAVDSAGFNRDAYVMEFLTGVTVEEEELWFASIGIGASKIHQQDSSLQDETTWALRMLGVWTPTPHLSLEANLYRQLILVNRLNLFKATKTGGDMEVRYLLADNLELNGNLGLYHLAFEESNREDDNWWVGVGLDYIFTPNVRLAAEYEFYKRSSSAAGESFDNNRAMVNVNLAM